MSNRGPCFHYAFTLDQQFTRRDDLSTFNVQQPSSMKNGYLCILLRLRHRQRNHDQSNKQKEVTLHFHDARWYHFAPPSWNFPDPACVPRNIAGAPPHTGAPPEP